MDDVLTCGCGCQRWSIGGHYFTCDKCGFIFWAHSIHAMNNLLEKDYKERPKAAPVQQTQSVNKGVDNG